MHEITLFSSLFFPCLIFSIAIPLFASSFFPPSAQLSLSPFLRLLVAYLSSALSHMQRAVRKDALHFLRLMLDAFGAQMWAFQTELLPIFLSILADRDVVNDAQIAKCAS